MATDPHEVAYGRRPVEEFERANKLTGLSRAYVLPDELAAWTPAQMDRFLHDQLTRSNTEGGVNKAEVLAVLNDVADRIVATNPELKSIPQRRDEIRDRYDFLAGVSAGYNPLDIALYLDTVTALSINPSHEIQMKQFRQTTEMHDRLQAIGKVLETRNGGYTEPRGGTHFAAQTLDLIEQQLKAPSVEQVPSPAKLPKPK